MRLFYYDVITWIRNVCNKILQEEHDTRIKKAIEVHEALVNYTNQLLEVEPLPNIKTIDRIGNLWDIIDGAIKNEREYEKNRVI